MNYVYFCIILNHEKDRSYDQVHRQHVFHCIYPLLLALNRIQSSLKFSVINQNSKGTQNNCMDYQKINSQSQHSPKIESTTTPKCLEIKPVFMMIKYFQNPSNQKYRKEKIKMRNSNTIYSMIAIWKIRASMHRPSSLPLNARRKASKRFRLRSAPSMRKPSKPSRSKMRAIFS